MPGVILLFIQPRLFRVPVARLVLLLALLPLLTFGQAAGRRGVFSVLGAFGYSGSPVKPRVTVLSGSYALKPEQVDNPECYDDQGRLVDCNKANYQAGLGLMYRHHDRDESSGWMIQTWASYQQQSYSLAYPSGRSFSIPVNCTPSIRRSLRSNALNASVGRFWPTGDRSGGMQVLARLGVMYASNFRYLRGGQVVHLPDPRPINYVNSSGDGTLIEMTTPRTQANWLLTPELGLTAGDVPLELVASVAIPLRERTVFSELHTFADNRYVVGKNRVEYSNFAVYLTARLRLDFKRKPRLKRAEPVPRPAPEPGYRPAPPPPIPALRPPEPSSAPSEYDRQPLNSPLQLRVFFALEKAELKAESFDELLRVTRWLRENPGVRIRLEGHTDVVGDAAKNKALSQQRVVAVKNYLSLHGIASDRVETLGYGSTRPLRTACPPPDYCPENRRVEMVILRR